MRFCFDQLQARIALGVRESNLRQDGIKNGRWSRANRSCHSHEDFPGKTRAQLHPTYHEKYRCRETKLRYFAERNLSPRLSSRKLCASAIIISPCTTTTLRFGVSACSSHFRHSLFQRLPKKHRFKSSTGLRLARPSCDLPLASSRPCPAWVACMDT